MFPKEIQLKNFTAHSSWRAGCYEPFYLRVGGKTSTHVLAVLNRLKHTSEGVPHVLILVPDKEKVLEVVSRFELLNKNKPVLIVGLYAAPRDRKPDERPG